MQYIPPVMVVVGLCSVNEKIIPFTLSKAGFFILTTAVIMIYALLLHVVGSLDGNPKMWSTLYLRISAKLRDLAPWRVRAKWMSIEQARQSWQGDDRARYQALDVEKDGEKADLESTRFESSCNK
jgi:hypothetical protein